MKKIAIIGAGISGLFTANLFKQNSGYQITIYEKKSVFKFDEGYGIQLSTNSVKLLNKIGFNSIDANIKFNPQKIDFYEINKNEKICDLNISYFNSENCKYTTLKRSTLIKFLIDRLEPNVIKYDHDIEKIKTDKDQINLIFNNNAEVNCDHLIIADGIFSKAKTIISENRINPIYNNSLAIRGSISKDINKDLNENNISLFLGNNFHYVTYSTDLRDNKYNFIGILKYDLSSNELNNYSLFKEDSFQRIVKDKLQNKMSINILKNLDSFKCFPVFVSKEFFKPVNNISLIGDAFYAFPPSFAQGASQSIESGSELFDSIVNNNSNFFSNRVAKTKMINNRSKFNQFAFHLSNPINIIFRNIILKLMTKNKRFLENYLGKIYKD